MKTSNTKTPTLIIALLVLAAAAGSSALVHVLAGSIESAAVRHFVRAIIFRSAAGELFLVALGLAGLLFSLRNARKERSRLEAETRAIKEEGERLRGELAEARRRLDESEAVLETSRRTLGEEEARREGEIREALTEERRGAAARLESAAAVSSSMLNALVEKIEGELAPLKNEPPGETPVEEAAGPAASPPPETVSGDLENNSGIAAGGTDILEGLRGAEELKRRLDEGLAQVRASGELSTAIAAGVEKITALAGSISRISAQTNILSMNAAIESAHAGSAGAGFAVVAEEIKKLAESTAINVKQIHAEIKAITEKTAAGVRTGEAAVLTMNGLETLAENMSRLLAALASGGGETNGGVPADDAAGGADNGGAPDTSAASAESSPHTAADFSGQARTALIEEFAAALRTAAARITGEWERIREASALDANAAPSAPPPEPMTAAKTPPPETTSAAGAPQPETAFPAEAPGGGIGIIDGKAVRVKKAPWTVL